jgi:O-antigen/teichoic acid export membrane protein
VAVNIILKKLVSNAATLLSGSIPANIFNLLSIAILARSLEVNLFGYFSLFVVYSEIFLKLFNTQNFEIFIQQANIFKNAKKFKNISMLIKYFFIIDLITLTFGFIAALSLSKFFIFQLEIPVDYLVTIRILCLSIIALIFNNMSMAIFRFYNYFQFQALNTLLNAFLKFCFFVGVSYNVVSLENFAIALVVAQAISALFSVFLINHILSKNLHSLFTVFLCKIDRSLFKKLNLIKTTIYHSLNVSIKQIPRNLDIVILGKFSNPEIVAFFKIAKDISNIILKILDSIYQAMYPEISRLFSINETALAKLFTLKISALLSLLGILGYIIFFFFGNFFIEILFGANYLNSYPMILIYLIGILLQIATLPLAPILFAKGFFKESFFNMLVSNIFCLPIMIILIYKFNGLGASASFVVFYIIWITLTLNTIKRKGIFI